VLGALALVSWRRSTSHTFLPDEKIRQCSEHFMTPPEFLFFIARPNALAAIKSVSDVRQTVNAILALDAFVGILHANILSRGVLIDQTEEAFRDQLAATNTSFQVLGDTAAAIKHGLVDRDKKLRLVRRPDQIQKHAGKFDSGFLDSSVFDTDRIWIETGGMKAFRADTIIRDVLALCDGLAEQHFPSAQTPA
jgi:hypothetical protein